MAICVNSKNIRLTKVIAWSVGKKNKTTTTKEKKINGGAGHIRIPLTVYRWTCTLDYCTCHCFPVQQGKYCLHFVTICPSGWPYTRTLYYYFLFYFEFTFLVHLFVVSLSALVCFPPYLLLAISILPPDVSGLFSCYTYSPVFACNHLASSPTPSYLIIPVTAF